MNTNTFTAVNGSFSVRVGHDESRRPLDAAVTIDGLTITARAYLVSGAFSQDSGEFQVVDRSRKALRVEYLRDDRRLLGVAVTLTEVFTFDKAGNPATYRRLETELDAEELAGLKEFFAVEEVPTLDATLIRHNEPLA